MFSTLANTLKQIAELAHKNKTSTAKASGCTTYGNVTSVIQTISHQEQINIEPNKNNNETKFEPRPPTNPRPSNLAGIVKRVSQNNETSIAENLSQRMKKIYHRKKFNAYETNDAKKCRNKSLNRILALLIIY